MNKIEDFPMENKTILKVGVLIERRGQLLLIKELNWRNKKYLWNIIKGTFDSVKDKDLLDTALREAKEEANARVKIKNLSNILYLKKHGTTLVQFNFVATLADLHWNPEKFARIQNKHDDGHKEDIIEVKFFSPRDLIKIPKKELMGERTYVSIKSWLQKESLSKDSLKILKDY